MTTGSGTTACDGLHVGAHVGRLVVVPHGPPAKNTGDPHQREETQPNGRQTRAGVETKRPEKPPVVQTKPGATRQGPGRLIQTLWAAQSAATTKPRMRAIRAIFIEPTFHGQ